MLCKYSMCVNNNWILDKWWNKNTTGPVLNMHTNELTMTVRAKVTALENMQRLQKVNVQLYWETGNCFGLYGTLRVIVST